MSKNYFEKDNWVFSEDEENQKRSGIKTEKTINQDNISINNFNKEVMYWSMFSNQKKITLSNYILKCKVKVKKLYSEEEKLFVVDVKRGIWKKPTKEDFEREGVIFKKINSAWQSEIKFNFNMSSYDDKKHWHRIDFIFNNQGEQLCRLNINGKHIKEPFELGEDKTLEIKLSFKNIKFSDKSDSVTGLLNLYVNNHHIFKNVNTRKAFQGFMGLGSYNADIEFQDIKITEDRAKNIFIIMPYDTIRNKLYKNIIIPIVEKLKTEQGYKFNNPIRFDASIKDSILLKELLEYMDFADIVIADVSEPNSNVFFEVGYCMAKGKKIMLIRDNESKLSMPSDLSSRRYFSYKSEEFFKKEINFDEDNFSKLLYDKLKDYLQDIDSSDEEVKFDFNVDNQKFLEAGRQIYRKYFEKE